jgi:hypothetical protein
MNVLTLAAYHQITRKKAMTKTEILLFNLLTLALLLAMFSLPAFPQIDLRARVSSSFMIFGLILILMGKELHE